jgi:hypothetical protein
MKLFMAVAAGVVAVGLSGCVSNTTQVKELAAADMKCSADAVQVRFEDRPYLGTTYYSASGCDKQRTYTCSKPLSIVAIPFGNSNCSHDGSALHQVLGVGIGIASHH